MMRCADADPCLEPLLPAAREARGAIHVCMRVRGVCAGVRQGHHASRRYACRLQR